MTDRYEEYIKTMETHINSTLKDIHHYAKTLYHKNDPETINLIFSQFLVNLIDSHWDIIQKMIDKKMDKQIDKEKFKKQFDEFYKP